MGARKVLEINIISLLASLESIFVKKPSVNYTRHILINKGERRIEMTLLNGPSQGILSVTSNAKLFKNKNTLAECQSAHVVSH